MTQHTESSTKQNTVMNFVLTKNLRLLALAFVLLSLTGCKFNQSQELNKGLQKKKITVIKVGEAIRNIEQNGFLKAISNVSYIPLSTDKNYLIANCSKIKYLNDRFYVLDRRLSSINVFDRAGKYLFSIGKIGRGPGEYLRLDDIDIDLANKKILALSNDNMSIFEYSLEGDFIRQVHCEFFGSYLEILDSTRALVNINYNNAREGGSKNLVVINRDGEVLSELMPFPPMASMSFQYSGFLTRGFEGFLVAHALSDTIYEIDQNTSLYPKYLVDLGSNAWASSNDIFDHQKFRNKGLEYAIVNAKVLESSRFLFLSYTKERRIQSGFSDLRNGKFYDSDSFSEDITFKFYDTPAGQINDSTFISVIYPQHVFVLSEHEKNLMESLKRTNPSLYNVLSVTKEEDNPILMIYSLNL